MSRLYGCDRSPSATGGQDGCTLLRSVAYMLSEGLFLRKINLVIILLYIVIILIYKFYVDVCLFVKELVFIICLSE